MIDMKNAFNLVTRQALLDELLLFSPELLPWVSWCYGSHPSLWHSLGQLSSEAGVQQGDPLGPLLFALVLHKVVSAIDADGDCLSEHGSWMMGCWLVKKLSVLQALSILRGIWSIPEHFCQFKHV